jgi:DNA-binding transcriptional MerR regulator
MIDGKRIAMAIHDFWEISEHRKHHYLPIELKIIASDIKKNIPIKTIAKIRGQQFNRKGPGLLKKIRQIKRCLEKGFTLEDIINKTVTEKYNKKSDKTMRTFRFYSEEEVILMKTEIATGEPIRQIAKRLSKQFNRPLDSVQHKLHTLKKDVPIVNEWKGPKRIVSKVRVSKPVVKSPEEGVKVPHGMTFEGTPKKIILCSDHFKIYF